MDHGFFAVKNEVFRELMLQRVPATGNAGKSSSFSLLQPQTAALPVKWLCFAFFCFASGGTEVHRFYSSEPRQS